MIKRILLASLFLFMPIFARGEIVVGSNMDEKNIPLDIDLIVDSFEVSLERSISISDSNPYTFFDRNRIQDKFYNILFSNYTDPYSLRDLIDACKKGLGKTRTKECVDFARLYVNKLASRGVIVATSVTTQQFSNAIEIGELATVEKYISQGGNVNVLLSDSGTTPLIRATILGREQIVKTLLNAGAYVNFVNKNGTALSWAVYTKRQSLINILIDAGADVNVTTIIGKPLIEGVIDNRDKNTFNLFVERGVNKSNACSSLENATDWAYYQEAKNKVCF